MDVHLREAVVQKRLESQPGASWYQVQMEDGEERRALAYDDLVPSLEAGSKVVLNVTASDLGLGTAVGDLIVAASRRSSLPGLDRRDTFRRSGGHIMKLPYTPLQGRVLSAEEPASPHHDLLKVKQDIDSLPVVVSTLHSQLPVSAAAAHYQAGGGSPATSEGGPAARVVFIMCPGGALPAALSRHLARLRQRGWLQAVITCGSCFGGDYEAVNLFTALLTARWVCQASVAVIGLGPGITGTGTPLGHTAMSLGTWIDTVNALGGRPVIAPRLDFSASRPRHQGLSHHYLQALRLAAHTPGTLAMPSLAGPQQQQVQDQLAAAQLGSRVHVAHVETGPFWSWFTSSSYELSSMGRSLAEAKPLFAAAGAAGLLAQRWTAK